MILAHIRYCRFTCLSPSMGLHFGQIVWVGLLALLLFLVFNEQLSTDCSKCEQLNTFNTKNSDTMCSPDMSITYSPNNSASLSIVVFGASGDLATRKLFPALYSLYIQGALPIHTNIVGYPLIKFCIHSLFFDSCRYARSKLERAEFAEKVTKHLRCKDAQKVNDFLSICHYVQGNYASSTDVEKLHNFLEQLETSKASSANRVSIV